MLYTLAGTGAQQTDLGDRFLYNLATSYRLIGGAGGQAGPAGPMHLGAPIEPMYHGAGRAPAHEHQATASPTALDVVLELNGEWHGRQKVDGAADVNSGGTVVYLSPGVRLSGDKWSAFASFGLPIVTNLYGTQVEPDYRVISGAAVRF